MRVPLVDARDFSGATVGFVSPKREQVDALRLHSDDTGSAPVQIAGLSARIEELTEHLKQHRGDKHTRYGLLRMVGRRSRLLKYLRRTQPETYREVITTLGLRVRQ
ncbi:MAG: 30S ribosomal protein S15 [Chloroflexi bacterium]|nr:30S ribosomal protein S15 [Chloroflexota bacterium]